MKKFIVQITETLQKSVTVQADSWQEAVKQVRKDYADEKIVLTEDDYFDSEIEPLTF